jgi:hypothetical protein
MNISERPGGISDCEKSPAFPFSMVLMGNLLLFLLLADIWDPLSGYLLQLTFGW